MTDAAFDQERADQLVHELGEAIVADDVYADRDWTAITLIYTFDGAEREFGYVYWGDDEWQGEAPDSFDTIRIAKDLRDAMTVPGKAPWKKCLVQISAESGKIALDFDYEGSKWQPDMADPAAFARSVRP